ncbi:MAG: DUF4416 family protein [Desulfobaccales bacterium]
MAVKPVVALIIAREDLIAPVLRRLTEYRGPVDLVSPLWPFSATDYYVREMGGDLWRCLASFLHLAEPATLADWKIVTNSLEQRFTAGGRRLVNIDPGYVARERLVLATGKNYVHRIYLGQGIYGDLTLTAGPTGFQALSWTYPDYASGPLPELLALVRRKYLWQLKQLTQR